MRTHTSFWEATATLIGTIVGAGILGLPYAVAQVGAIPGLLMLLLIGVASLIINLMFAEVVLRTRERHQVAGCARKYLGNIAFWLANAAAIIGSYGALTVYLIGEGEALSALFGTNKTISSLVFFAIGAFILLVGLRLVKVFELWMVAAFVVIILAIVGVGVADLNLINFAHIDLSRIIIPYGVILFAYSGASSVVSLREILRKDEKKVRRAVLIGSLVPLVIYVVFTMVVVGITGSATTPVATIGLGEKLGPAMLIFGNLFAFFAMGTSFLTVGMGLRQTFQFDLKCSKFVSWLAVIAVPLTVFLFGLRDFILAMEIAGGIAVGLTGLIIIAGFAKAKKRGDRLPEFHLPRLRVVSWLLAAMFAAGICYTLYNVI
ncbi:hypothetical protein A2482_05130 [Candidatus Falkowbacteria bacterium RIFOXYC2_FULL_48_21]|uniref:Amino acid transporter transmembrane domain-containing protein n=1 Tax=Candidatus Falkowbacteria bacterium RIFOXYC2_FULL_48_21 TaxID=1798005 RepID=A0A1F5TBS2_9BACT|nr:MAG: hypothetical protein A2482_05130 [Candidatus Falkowbacteria bacterium RIFOXYC2_FULL_48_21]